MALRVLKTPNEEEEKKFNIKCDHLNKQAKTDFSRKQTNKQKM
jgi:hypothetical protein